MLVLGYFALDSAETGEFGFGSASGWALYSRVAPFADCDRFEPPAGTEELCERTDSSARSGPDFTAGSRARRPGGRTADLRRATSNSATSRTPRFADSRSTT